MGTAAISENLCGQLQVFSNKFNTNRDKMPNLKLIGLRLKSVTNIQKITQSMKMVSAAKFAKAERDLKAARPLGEAAQTFYKTTEIESDKPQPKELYVALTSDRGLAGAVHSSICKNIRQTLHDKVAAGESLDNVKILCVGDKSRAFMQRFFPKQLIMVGSEIGRLPPTFNDAAKIANAIMTCGHELDSDVIQSYMEYSLASLIYYALKEGATSEQSSRMTAMDNSSKNAGEMIDKLRITFNRTRQAVITGELIEIISGAAAL